MKHIGAKSTSGPEAILIAAIKYWMDPDIKMFKDKILSIYHDHPEDFDSKSEIRLGTITARYAPIDKIIDHFWIASHNDKVIKFMIEMAVTQRKDSDIRGNMVWAKDFVRHSILSEFGSWIKECRKS